MASGDPLVKRTLDYIADNLSKPFGAAQIADALGVSRNLLDKHFRADLNRSIGAEITRQRIAMAKLLLRNSGETIAKIARRTGFCNPSHLSNTFRAVSGVTPREYRAAGGDENATCLQARA